MSLELTIQENTAALRELIDVLKSAPTVLLDATPSMDLESSRKPVNPEPKAPAKRDTKKAASLEPTAQSPDVGAAAALETAAVAAPVADKPTYDDASVAVVAVASKLGRAKALEILGRSKADAKSLRDIAAADYAAVISACEAALA